MAGQTSGGQMGQQGTHAQLIPQTGRSFDGDLTGELHAALEDFEKVADVTRWCIDNMIDEGPHMSTCIRVCQDVGDLAELNDRLIARDSIYGLEAAMLFASVAGDALQEIERHQNPHCQETAATIRRALDSTYNLLEAFGQPQLIQQVEKQLHRAHQQFEQAQEMPPAAQGQIGQQPMEPMPQEQIGGGQMTGAGGQTGQMGGGSHRPQQR